MKRLPLAVLFVLLAACGRSQSAAETESAIVEAEDSAPASESIAPAPAASAVEEGIAEASAVPEQPAPAAAPPRWIVDKAKSSLRFRATQTGREFEGEFERFEAKIAFDPDNLSNSSIDATVDMTSARTGDKQRDTALPGEDWFAVKRFPTAWFFADGLVKTDEGAYEARGALTMRGEVRPLTLPFTLAIDGDTATARGAVTILRTDFGVGQGDFATGEWVGLEVKVEVDIVATRGP
jgi:polyisoprenoid-binding protein YceI